MSAFQFSRYNFFHTHLVTYMNMIDFSWYLIPQPTPAPTTAQPTNAPTTAQPTLPPTPAPTNEVRSYLLYIYIDFTLFNLANCWLIYDWLLFDDTADTCTDHSPADSNSITTSRNMLWWHWILFSNWYEPMWLCSQTTYSPQGWWKQTYQTQAGSELPLQSKEAAQKDTFSHWSTNTASY